MEIHGLEKIPEEQRDAVMVSAVRWAAISTSVAYICVCGVLSTCVVVVCGG